MEISENAQSSPSVADPVVSEPKGLYPVAEAIASALASPLEFVGMGPWPGTMRRFSCAYKNDHILVVENVCLSSLPDALRVVIISPTRGRVTIAVEGKPGSGAIESLRRENYRNFTVATELPIPAE
ncbi:MAG: hypothetical protein GY811_07235 [Myxococcales bacterium]|nr:hypothetical protein [Myxococcales bacterium]